MFNKIKVLKNRKPVVITDPNTMQSVVDVVETFKMLDAKFPDAEGFAIEVWLYPICFSRKEWREITKHIESHNLNMITLILFTK